MDPPPSQTIVGDWNQITILILHYISFRLVILKNTDTPTQASDILGRTLSFKVINFSFKIAFFFLKFQLPSRLTVLRLSTVI